MDAVEDDLRVAGQDVTDFSATSLGDEVAVIAAATYPDQLLGCATMHGTDQKRRLIAERAELEVRRVLEATRRRVRPTRPVILFEPASVLNKSLRGAK